MSRVEVSLSVPAGKPLSMGQFESLLWERRPRRVGRRRVDTPVALCEGPLTEWTARPLGRLGRPLLGEIEAYLEFYAIARMDGARLT